MKKFLVMAAILVGFALFVSSGRLPRNPVSQLTDVPNLQDDDNLGAAVHALSIGYLKEGEYPGSDIVFEETLASGSNYSRFLASYQSAGLKIYGLLTVPNGEAPEGGYPAIIFNHGYIPPAQYRTTERYVSYIDGFARGGYVVFKPDYRGHGNSEGEPTGAYGSPGYTIDVLNAVASIKRLKDPATHSDASGQAGSGPLINPEKVGMWGHSLGGYITLRVMVVSNEVSAGVIWAGVVGSYPDLLNNWRRRTTASPPPLPTGARRWRQTIIEEYGTPETNPQFWASISANSYLDDIAGPLQLHHGTADPSVPVEFSQKLAEQAREAEKVMELYTYAGDDHNLSKNFGLAMSRSVAFFDKYLK